MRNKQSIKPIKKLLMKKLLLSIVLSCTMISANAIVLDYYLISSFCESVDKNGEKTYSCTQEGKVYKLTLEEYEILLNGGVIEK